MPLYREDFEGDGARCTVPGCEHGGDTCELYLHSVCHPCAPTWARVRGDVLTIECAICRRKIGAFVLASRAHDRP